VVAEVVLFVFATQILRRWSAAQLMALAAVGGILRWTALGLSSDMYVLAGVQWMHALSFAAAHVATMSFIGHAVPPERSATAQSLYSAFNIAAHALTVGAITPVFAEHGGRAFLPMALLSIGGGALAAYGMRASSRARG
jgi:PPP family 3-phenylpropionic acid transporter